MATLLPRRVAGATGTLGADTGLGPATITFQLLRRGPCPAYL